MKNNKQKTKRTLYAIGEVSARGVRFGTILTVISVAVGYGAYMLLDCIENRERKQKLEKQQKARR